MSNSLEFAFGSSTGNDSVFGALRHWVQSSNGIGVEATYNRGRPKKAVEDSFFSVVWQVKVEKPGQAKNPMWARTVHLQIESPRHNKQPSLNDLKREMIKGLLAADLGALAQNNGYEYDDRVGRRTSDDQIRARITITPFKLVLDDSQAKAEPKEMIKAAHNAVGWKVDAVLNHLLSKSAEAG